MAVLKEQDGRVADAKILSEYSLIAKTGKRPVIVDMREFRAQLPFILHMKGFKVIPKTIGVGDYILTKDLAVERKSLGDLQQSLNSGRLYEQAKQMTMHFKYSIILIETDKSLPVYLRINLYNYCRPMI